MTKLTKRVINATYTSKFAHAFQCPICKSDMHVSELKSIICKNNHTYDFAKQGYLNFLSGPSNIKYGRELFESRQQIISGEGFFEPLTEKIIELIYKHFPNKNPLHMIDIGCGEGSHLAHITETLSHETVSVGIDISKEAIMEAAKHYEEFIWTVADLVRTPFKQEQFDIILNILSPTNNTEFNRILKETGCIIKVIPGAGYLKEIREYLFKDKPGETYSNQPVLEHFKDNFSLVEEENITYTKTLEQEALQALIQMTPLAWDMNQEEKAYFSSLETAEFTVDLTILFGKKFG